MAWHFPRLTRRATPLATGPGGIGSDVPRPAALPGERRSPRPHDHAAGTFRSPLRKTRDKTRNDTGVRTIALAASPR
jgi:hypothetical protein